MNERKTPEPSEQKISSKLVPFPVTPPIKHKPSFKKYWLIAGLSSLLVIAAVAATWWALGERSTVRYVTAPVAKGAVIRTVTATGTVNPELTIIVGAAVSGIIKELNCDYNTKVKKGQICAKIDPRPYQSIVDENRANLAVAKAQLEKDTANLCQARARPCCHPLADPCRLPGRL
jgi:HlyD family secretion protein